MNKVKLSLSKPWMFFLFTFVFSWSFWSIAIILNQPYTYFPTIMLFALGGFGPSLIGILLTYLTKSKDEIKEFWYRSYDFKRIGFWWFGVILFLSLAPLLIAGVISFLFNGSGIWFDPIFFSGFLVNLIFLIVGVIAEEFGWRGYVLDPLQNKYNAFISSLIIGFFWGLWHLPLFFIRDTYQQSLGVFSIEFWMFFILLFPHSIMYTYIYNSTNRSILSAMLFHFCINFFGQLFLFDILVRIISDVIIFIFAILIILLYQINKGPKKMKQITDKTI